MRIEKRMVKSVWVTDEDLGTQVQIVEWQNGEGFTMSIDGARDYEIKWVEWDALRAAVKNMLKEWK